MLVIRIIMTVILVIKIILIGAVTLSFLADGDIEGKEVGIMSLLALTDILAIISVWILR